MYGLMHGVEAEYYCVMLLTSSLNVASNICRTKTKEILVFLQELVVALQEG